MKLIRSPTPKLFKNILLIIAFLLLTTFIQLINITNGAEIRRNSLHSHHSDEFKPKLIKLDEWVVADLNTSTLVNNVSLLVTKLNNYTGSMANAFGLFHTELRAFEETLNQSYDIPGAIQQQIKEQNFQNGVILDILEPINEEFKQNLTRALQLVQIEIDDYYHEIKFATEESYGRMTRDLKNYLNEILSETEYTENSTRHGQVAVIDLVDLSKEYYNQFENGLMREAIALSEYRRVLKEKNAQTLHAMNESIIVPFYQCEVSEAALEFDNKTIACLQHVSRNGSSISGVLDLDEMIQKFEVRFREKRIVYLSFIDGQTDNVVDFFASTMKVFYEAIGKLKAENAPNGVVAINRHQLALLFGTALAVYFLRFLNLV